MPFTIPTDDEPVQTRDLPTAPIEQLQAEQALIDAGWRYSISDDAYHPPSTILPKWPPR